MGIQHFSLIQPPSNSNVTHSVILKPLVSGLFNVSWGQVSYTSADTGDKKVSLLSFLSVFTYCV